METIQLNVSHAFKNKTNLTGNKAAFGDSFKPARLTLAQFVTHATSGAAWTLHLFKANRRKGEYWQSSQLLALDLDACPLTIDQLAELPDVRERAYLLYPSPSSTPEQPKTRVVFVLSEPVTDPARWQALQLALLEHFKDLQPDPACKDLARLFYGSDKPGYIVLGNLAPLTWAGGLTAPQADQDAQRAAMRQQEIVRPINPAGSQAERIVQQRLNRALDELAAPAAGESRHDLMIKAGYWLYGHVKGGWPITSAEISNGIKSAMQRNGAFEKYGESEIDRCLKDTERGAKPVPLEIRTPKKADKPARQRTISTARLEGAPDAQTVRYVGDDLPPAELAKNRTLLIAAPVGMGKTQAAAAYVNGLPDEEKITGLAQYRLLTAALRDVLTNAAHYEDADGKHQTALQYSPRFVTSLTSLPKFERPGGIVIVDEIEGVLQFLNSDTFKAGTAVQSWRAFKQTVTGAQQLIGMDAGLSDITIDLIRRWRGDVTVRRYRSQAQRGKVTFLRDRYAGLYQIGKLLDQRRGAVYVACSSETTATDITDRHSADYRVLKVTRDTSNTDQVQAFIENKNNERAAYDLVVYTSAMGAGVSIDETVFALVCIFDQTPLPPEQAIQLFGRVRNAQRRYVVAPPYSEGSRTPTAEELLADKIKRENWTAGHIQRQPDTGGDYLEMLQLWAQFEARRLQESAQWRAYFAARLQANGYTMQGNNARAPLAFIEGLKAWKAERKDSDWQTVLDTLITRDDEDIERLRIARVEITRDLKLQNVRYKIERALGHADVTETDRDLMQRQGRRALFALTDLLADESAAIATDRAQANEGRPLQKRAYKTLSRGMFSKLMRAAAITGDPQEQLLQFAAYFSQERSAAEITERFQALADPANSKLLEMFQHRGDNAQTVTGICRRILRYFGLEVISRQTGRGDSRQMAYRLDLDVYEYRLARARRAYAERTKKMQDESYLHIFSTPAPQVLEHPQHRRETPPGEGWRLITPVQKSTKTRDVKPIGTGKSNPNPFAVGGTAA